MTLRNKLLLNFGLLILFTLILFGFSAYQAAYNNAIDNDMQLLKKHVLIDSERYSIILRDSRSIAEITSDFSVRTDNNHFHIIVDRESGLVIRDSVDSAILKLVLDQQLAKIMEAKENGGKVTVDNVLYVWAKAELKKSKYSILYIEKSMLYIEKGLSKLASRLFVMAIIILWVAAWIALIVSTLITKKINIQQKEIEYQATHDIVTGLVNRQYFVNKVDALIAEKNFYAIGVVTIGFNRFREINDGLGYAFGDQLLAAFAKRLNKEFWQRDTVASFGGDQFALLLPIKEKSHWSDVVEKVKLILSVPFTIQDINIFVDVSMGISLYPDNGKDSLSLIKCSEIAMHSAKKMGLFFECYNVDNDPNNIDRLELISELNDAIRKDEFELYYQPKIDIEKHCLTGVEALIRWDNPKRGFVRPDIFIELAEQGRIIKDITNWVIDEALRQCSIWHKSERMYSVSINISACLLIENDIVIALEKSIKKYDIDPSYLILEITETAIIMDPKRALETMNNLKALGLQLSIDDFGTGYTSISLIKNLPVSEIKVDKSFVLNMNTNSEDATLVKLIIDLAHTLNHKVVAEGIEGEEVLSMLNTMGCDIAQGFYLGKPMPANEFEAFKLK